MITKEQRTEIELTWNQLRLMVSKLDQLINADPRRCSTFKERLRALGLVDDITAAAGHLDDLYGPHVGTELIAFGHLD